jgi:hypothetical protein
MLMRNGINIFRVMKNMGVKSYLIDNDPFDWRPNLILYRVVLNTTRFSTWGILNKYWDEILNINDVLYTPILQGYSGYSGQGRTGDGKIIVCSQLRLYKATDGISIETAWNNFLHERKLCQATNFPQQVVTITSLFKRFMEALDHHKLTIVGWIRDKQNLEIYGNDEWAKFFPENYKGWLNEQQYVAKLMEPNIFILPNISATYLDAFGPLFDMVRFGKKFLHPKVISGNIPCFEFSCADELNDKLADFPNQAEQMIGLKSTYQTSVNSVIERITRGCD